MTEGKMNSEQHSEKYQIGKRQPIMPYMDISLKNHFHPWQTVYSNEYMPTRNSYTGMDDKEKDHPNLKRP